MMMNEVRNICHICYIYGIGKAIILIIKIKPLDTTTNNINILLDHFLLFILISDPTKFNVEINGGTAYMVTNFGPPFYETPCSFG